MMKVIGQLWCHEVTRTFADRLISEDGWLENNNVLIIKKTISVLVTIQYR
jgi:hypothetical protein